MSFNITDLTGYVNETSSKLVKEAIVTGRTVDLVTVQGGVKYQETINTISSELEAQAGGCGLEAQGSTVLSQRVITVDTVAVVEKYCLDDLEKYYTSTMMNPGSYNETIPFEQVFAENKRDATKALVENLVWKGDKDNGLDNSLSRANGFIKLLDAEVVAPYAGTYTIADFGTDVIDTVDEMISKMNEDILDKEDITLFMSYANYRTDAKAVRDANLFHYTGAESQGDKFSQYHPGTNVKVVAVKGLSAVNRLILTPASNLVVGTDLMSDAEDFKLFYNEDEDLAKLRIKFKLGTQVQFVDQVVMYTGV